MMQHREPQVESREIHSRSSGKYHEYRDQEWKYQEPDDNMCI
jgi:hypothetical protein